MESRATISSDILASYAAERRSRWPECAGSSRARCTGTRVFGLRRRRVACASSFTSQWRRQGGRPRDGRALAGRVRRRQAPTC